MGYVEVKLLLSRIQNVCVAGWRTPVWLWILFVEGQESHQVSQCVSWDPTQFPDVLHNVARFVIALQAPQAYQYTMFALLLVLTRQAVTEPFHQSCMMTRRAVGEAVPPRVAGM
jgi:hypothetical protein